MSTHVPSTAPPPVPDAPQGQREIKLIGHSSLFYWWPVWVFGFFMAAWTGTENHRMAVIPGDATVTLNLRYPPDRSPSEAEAHLRGLVPEGARLEIVSASPPGRVVTSSPLVESLREAGGLELEPKQAWTNVADFSAAGIDAVNYGPGHTEYAHRSDELVRVDALVESYEVLAAFVRGGLREDTA